MSDPQGLVYDPAARDYERGRTPWPIGVAEGVDGEVVLDLAAGTGKLTRTLLQRFPHVIAVEPLAEMRGLGERAAPNAEWLDGTAESIPLGDSSVDAAFVADAFHWFDSQRAVAELARVVRPRGLLVVMFAAWEGTWDPELPAEAGEAIEEVSRRTGETGAPRFKRGDWRAGFTPALFGELEQRDVHFNHEAQRDDVIAYYLSMSTIAARPVSEREELAVQLRNIVPDRTYRLRLRAETFQARRNG
jgi:SAM-dependent methyltransferase